MAEFIFPSELGYGQTACGVYKMKFDSGAYYIGSSLNLKQRMWSWKFKMNTGVFKNYKVADEFQKTTKVVFEILEIVDDPVLRRYREDLYIKLHFGNPLFLNSAPNAFNGSGSKKILRKKRKVNQSQCKQVVKVNEIGEIIERYESIAAAERENSIAHLSDCFIHSGRKVAGMVFRLLDEFGNIIPVSTPPPKKERKKGYKVSPEARQRLKEAMLKRIANGHFTIPKHAKEIIKKDKDGNEIERYQSIIQAAKAAGATDRKNFAKVVNRKESKTGYYKGFFYSVANPSHLT